MWRETVLRWGGSSRLSALEVAREHTAGISRLRDCLPERKSLAAIVRSRVVRLTRLLVESNGWYALRSARILCITDLPLSECRHTPASNHVSCLVGFLDENSSESRRATPRSPERYQLCIVPSSLRLTGRYARW